VCFDLLVLLRLLFAFRTNNNKLFIGLMQHDHGKVWQLYFEFDKIYDAMQHNTHNTVAAVYEAHDMRCL
jgi:hypothetical protein